MVKFGPTSLGRWPTMSPTIFSVVLSDFPTFDFLKSDFRLVLRWTLRSLWDYSLNYWVRWIVNSVSEYHVTKMFAMFIAMSICRSHCRRAHAAHVHVQYYVPCSCDGPCLMLIAMFAITMLPCLCVDGCGRSRRWKMVVVVMMMLMMMMTLNKQQDGAAQHSCANDDDDDE